MKSAESSPVDTLSPVLQQDGTARRQALSRACGKNASWATALTNPVLHMSPLTSVSMYTLTLPAQKGGRASTRWRSIWRSLPRPTYGACSTVLDTATHSASSLIAPAGAATPASRFVPVHPRLCREPAAQASSPPTAPACACKKPDCVQCESRASPPVHAAWVRYHEELVGLLCGDVGRALLEGPGEAIPACFDSRAS